MGSTNHPDMEGIEALNLALGHYEGTLIFVSQDREFVSSLANRIIEIKKNTLRASKIPVKSLIPDPGYQHSLSGSGGNTYLPLFLLPRLLFTLCLWSGDAP
ncbi:MAG: hypothetical protein QGD92_14605 [Gammaproteobacteria bacterium]|nr:hypothetical protein [Gammaproteobacteria bacterium]